MELKVIKKSIYSVPDYSKRLNVAAYIRVSTESENQIFSYESQIKYYSNLISRNANWNFIDVYADYGLSGTSVNKRKEFRRMINDAFDGKIDLILTKSISRFARNTENLLSFVRMLRNHNVAVYFEEEKIYTLNMESEFLLSVLASVAEQEAINTSEHIKHGFQQIIQNGGLISGRKRYGYDIVDGNFVINKKEAKVVKKIFEMYIGGMESGDIAKYLNQKKVPTAKGAKWDRGRIRDYLLNEIYVGDLLQGKCKNIRINGEKKQIRNKNGEKYLIKNHHEAIISREMFDEVKKILDQRNTQKTKTENLFPNKINCGFCGCSMTVSQSREHSKYYKCCNKKRKKCKSKMTREDILIEAFQMSMTKLLNTKNRENNFIDYKKIMQNKTSIENKIDIVIKKQSSLAERFMNKEINIGKYKYELNQLNDDLSKLNITKENIEFELEKYNEIIKSLKRLYSIIENEFDKDNFNIEFFNKIIQIVIIGGISEKGTRLPHLIRFIYNDKEKLFKDGVRMQGKQYMDNSNRTITILKFRLKHDFPKMPKNKPSVINSSLIQFEIER